MDQRIILPGKIPVFLLVGGAIEAKRLHVAVPFEKVAVDRVVDADGILHDLRRQRLLDLSFLGEKDAEQGDAGKQPECQQQQGQFSADPERKKPGWFLRYRRIVRCRCFASDNVAFFRIGDCVHREAPM
jgi:hypothetical protein